MKNNDVDTIPGRVRSHSKEGLVVETLNGLILAGALQLAGRKRLQVLDFLRGVPLKSGTVLGKAT